MASNGNGSLEIHFISLRIWLSYKYLIIWIQPNCVNIIFFSFLPVELYMSPVETWCRNINYFIPEEGKTKDFKVEQMTKIRKFY